MSPLRLQSHTALQQGKLSSSPFDRWRKGGCRNPVLFQRYKPKVILTPELPLFIPLPLSSPLQSSLTWARWRKHRGAGRPGPRAPARSLAGTRPRPAPGVDERVPGARLCAARAPGDLQRWRGSGVRVKGQTFLSLPLLEPPGLSYPRSPPPPAPGSRSDALPLPPANSGPARGGRK